MFISELSEPQLLVIYPGRFQPFHKGHKAVYDWLTGKFGGNSVYIATSNKLDGDRSPFTFAEKQYFMQLTGVPTGHIIQASQPYQITSVQNDGGLQISNPENTVVIFAVSEKDMAEDPRFKSWTKKDGSPAYFQPLTDIKQTENMNKHGYILTVPTFDFNVAGDPMQSASELRAEYRNADEKKRQLIVKDLFGRYTREAEQIMNNKLSPEAPVQEPKLPKQVKLQKVAKPKAEPVAESIFYQGYQVDIDPVRKELIVSRGGQVLHRENTRLVGRPASATTIRARLSAIIDKLEDDKYPDDLEMREATIGSQMDFNKQLQMRKMQADLAKQKGAQQAPQEPVVKTPQVPYTQTMDDKRAKLSRLNQLLPIKQKVEQLKQTATKRAGYLPPGLEADLEDYYTLDDVDAHFDEMLAAYQKQLNSLEQYLKMQKTVWKKPIEEGATVAYVVQYFNTKTGDKGESTVSALTQQDAADKIVELMHERGYDIVVNSVRSAYPINEFAPGGADIVPPPPTTKKNDPEAYAREMAREKSRRRVMPPVSVFEEPVKEMDKSQPGQQRHGDYPPGAKGTDVKPVTPKKVVKDLTKVLDRAFDKEKPVKEMVEFAQKQTKSGTPLKEVLKFLIDKQHITIEEVESFLKQLNENAIKEEAGVGVIASKKQDNDPRYSMSLTKDVRPGAIKKNLRAFKLESK